MAGGTEENTTGSKPKNQPKVLFDDKEEMSKAELPHVDGPRIVFSPDESAEVSEAHSSAPKGKGRPSVPFGTPQPPTPKGKSPRVLADGKIRKRMSCTVEDIQMLEATVSETDAKRAIRIINGINIDDEYFNDVLRFGSELQAEHGAIAEAELAIANSDALRKAQSYLAAMLQLLTDLDPKKVFSATNPSIGELLRRLAVPTQPPADVFATKYPQLLTLAQKIKALEADLVLIAENLAVLQQRYTLLIGSVASHILAARFIVKFVSENPDSYGKQAHYVSQANTLEARIASLLATRATLEIGNINNKALKATMLNLIESSRGMLGEDLPAFHNAYTTALMASMQPKHRSNEAWFTTVRESHELFVHKLMGDKQ